MFSWVGCCCFSGKHLQKHNALLGTGNAATTEGLQLSSMLLLDPSCAGACGHPGSGVGSFPMALRPPCSASFRMLLVCRSHGMCECWLMPIWHKMSSWPLWQVGFLLLVPNTWSIKTSSEAGSSHAQFTFKVPISSSQTQQTRSMYQETYLGFTYLPFPLSFHLFPLLFPT